jgi:hypothetical protein
MNAILHTRFSGSESLEPYGVEPKKHATRKGVASILVKERWRSLGSNSASTTIERTIRDWGIHLPEMDRLTASLDYQRRQGPALVATIAPLNPARLVRELARIMQRFGGYDEADGIIA